MWKVNLICFLMLLPIMYDDEYAAVLQQKWSDMMQEDVCEHRGM